VRNLHSELKRYQRWLEIAADLAQGTRTALDAYQIIGHGLLETFHALGSSWNVVDEHWNGKVTAIWTVEALPKVPEMGRTPDANWQPLLQWYARTSATEPQSMLAIPQGMIGSDVLGGWREFARPLGIEHQMSIPLPLPGVPHCAFVLARPDQGFDEWDQELARLIQPLLTAMLKQHEVLDAFERPHDRIGLTDREFAVLVLLGTGKTATAIGHHLGIAPRTVHKHLERVYRKLGASDRVSALVRAQAAGLNLDFPAVVVSAVDLKGEVAA
jgi:DNA-binding CsgD family transcriptional regulator